MGRCDLCSTTILWGGVRDADLRFCNDKCYSRGVLLRVSRDLPDDLVKREAQALHGGTCPRCQRPGPIDAHKSHRIWSLILLSSWRTQVHVCCRRCAIVRQTWDSVFSFAFGWWGFPWGLLMTPTQILRNILGTIRPPDRKVPSPALEQVVRLELAAQHLAESPQPEHV